MLETVNQPELLEPVEAVKEFDIVKEALEFLPLLDAGLNYELFE